MPLSQFTIADRKNIVDALQLSSDQVENDSRLYKELETIEQRDQQLSGLNRVQQIKGLLSSIQLLQFDIADIEESASSGEGSSHYGIKRVTVDREYTIEYASTDGKTGALGAKSAKLQELIEKLGLMLGLPWADDAELVFPVLWA